MKLDEMQAAWEIDGEIDELDLSSAARKTPNLHSKYLNELINYKLKLAKNASDITSMRSLRSRYYRSHLTTDELKELGWEPYPYKILKTEIDDMVEADTQMIRLKEREQYYKITISFLESVLGELKSRSFHCRVAMDWVKFRAGQ